MTIDIVLSNHCNFIEEIIEADISNELCNNNICTRFPPEPNGYLHIGHAKSICINFGLAAKYDGFTNLRFDDTNPSRENVEYINSIIKDIEWLGFRWNGKLRYASDYFQFLYEYAEYLICKDKAYVSDLSEDEIKKLRGDFFTTAREDPYRSRSISENLELFRSMRWNKFPDGSKVLRAKIDIHNVNMNMRDPIMYRIRHIKHYRTGYSWPIYPMYDYAHCISDAIENVTHSICTLEFENHRSLYNWFLDQDTEGKFFRKPLPKQIEFARLNLTHTVTSKRLLVTLINNGYVSGWDDPRLATIAGLRRRGYTANSIRNFANKVGVSKRDSLVKIDLLEHCIREDLKDNTKSIICILKPLKLVIDNMNDTEVYLLKVPYHKKYDNFGYRTLSLSKEIYIDRDDFMENPIKGWFRLAPGAEVRLKNACILRCTSVVKDGYGIITEVHCIWDPTSLGGNAMDGRKVRGTLHWLPFASAFKVEVRLYENLFNIEDTSKISNFNNIADLINTNSIKIIKDALIEPNGIAAKSYDRFQFERIGYFMVDYESNDNSMIYNQIVGFKSHWTK